MTDEAVMEMSRQLVLVLDQLFASRGIDDADAASVLRMAFTEALAQRFGPLGCIGTLRDMADTVERHVMRGMAAGNA